MATKYVKGKIYRLTIADLQPDLNQARSFMDLNALNELAASIGKFGVLVPPSSFVKTIRRRRSFKTDFRQPVSGGSNLGAVRIGLFSIEFLDDLDFIYTGKIFLKERKVGASFCIAPFDFDHESGLFLLGNKEIYLPSVLVFQVIESPFFPQAIFPEMNLFEQ